MMSFWFTLHAYTVPWLRPPAACEDPDLVLSDLPASPRPIVDASEMLARSSVSLEVRGVM